MKTCENCGNEHDGTYGSGRFCSTKCSKGFSTKAKRKEINDKVSNSLIGNIPWNKGKTEVFSKETLEKFSKRSKRTWEIMSEEKKVKLSNLSKNRKGSKKLKICKICEKEKEILFSSKLCSDCKIPLRLYKDECAFKFNVYDYPAEFNIFLINEFGWYSPKNSNMPNLNGISRDHIYSISDGFKNNINPAVISHPANCRLLWHLDNQSKGVKSFISYQDLLLRIEEWNQKY